jgi:hypothetical protein
MAEDCICDRILTHVKLQKRAIRVEGRQSLGLRTLSRGVIRLHAQLKLTLSENVNATMQSSAF